MRKVGLTAGLLLAWLACPASSLQIHHRVWDPTTPPPPFSLRGTLDLESSSLVPDDHAGLVLGSHLPETTLYQVALAREGLSQDDWAFSSVKACHLPQAKADIINIYFPSADKIPYGINIYLHPVPHNGSCPQRSFPPAPVIFSNTTLNVQLAASPPLPELHVPPPLSPQGEPITPEPEKSFLQKYWMYIAIACLSLMLGGGAPEEEGQGRASGSRAAGR